ncbi:hypothetical protein [Burkholderia cenocepacia]|jgi:hypothetical protein|uniref:hypothetical protein n=1 Tax=Burkholderia cenocepacia TaxID=95486 RepID=UPI00078B9A81|nr:hypothetical protein [Burkholderia cenocepacia]DAF77003.1 MAG TPA: hypothetical protein [Caudoviricetes sp.]AMU18855.1 hypothetical protein A3203_37570 [Burkholderia cenocepacia]MCW3585310.1 hypothetical protein [Burkholderia cenocepacia]MCW3627293.1 hypothetical protein [Burkholderia cenocepacia]MCW5184899.1 hypothetical protein [Burkholderia cenocepacia]
MAIVYSIPNQQEAETLAIRRVIRASNAEQMARRRASDEAERQALALRCADRAFAIVRSV